MSDLEKLLIHTFEQNAAIIKSAAMLAEAARQLMDAQDTIVKRRAEIECLKLDLAEARADSERNNGEPK